MSIKLFATAPGELTLIKSFRAGGEYSAAYRSIASRMPAAVIARIPRVFGDSIDPARASRSRLVNEVYHDRRIRPVVPR